MKLLHKLLGIILIGFHILLGILLSGLLFIPFLHARLPSHWVSRVIIIWSTWMCRLCGLRVCCTGKPACAPLLMVANHISWLDIFALLSTRHITFLSKQEVADWPVLGYLSRFVGTLYIRRGHFEAMEVVTVAITKRLQQGETVLFFPEGTSTNGQQVKRFHARLFQAALNANTPVQPVAVRYPYPSGNNVNPFMPFIGEDSFGQHLWRLLGEGPHVVELHFLPPIEASEISRRVLAEKAYQAITEVIT